MTAAKIHGVRMTDAHSIIYQQDCEFYRYQDQLKWSRFQLAAIIEGGMLYALWFPLIGGAEAIAVAFIGSGLVMVLFLVSAKDAYDATRHLDRIKRYEEENRRPLPLRRRALISGAASIWTAAILISSANALVIISTINREGVVPS